MTSIPLPDNAGKIDTFTRVEGADTVHMQAVVAVDPVTGEPLSIAADTTLAAQSAILQTQADMLQAQQDTLAAIQDLNDTMLTLLSAMLKKMPRLTTGDRLAAALVSLADYDTNGPYYGITVSGVGDPNGSSRYIYRMFEPWNFSDMGAARLYAQILVS